LFTIKVVQDLPKCCNKHGGFAEELKKGNTQRRNSNAAVARQQKPDASGGSSSRLREKERERALRAAQVDTRNPDLANGKHNT
jgi:hypothetical protein